jgi:membrane protease subunit HflC
MKQNTLIGLIVVAGLGAILAANSFFIVREDQQALITEFGNPVRAVDTAGLQFKIPVMQDVRYYERRLLEIDPPNQEVLLIDNKRLVVDAYARYRITNALEFYKNVRDEQGAQQRISQIINTSIRRVLGSSTQTALLSSERQRIMEEIQKEVADRASPYGVKIVDVRLRKADLPDQTLSAVFNRMKSERDREARELRAQGQETAQQIRSRADRERAVLLAEAQREAQGIRGEGDGKAIQIFAEAFGKDIEFYDFYRSLQAYRNSLANGDTTLVLSPDSEFFRYLGTAKPEKP